MKERTKRLADLEKSLDTCEPDVLAALRTDLGKADFEAHTNELGLVRHEIKIARRNLKRWNRTRYPVLEIFAQPGIAGVRRVPYGEVLIIVPWNFPLMLALAPLVSAIAAGNRVVIKPSELAPATADVLSKIVEKAFPDGWVQVVPGGPEKTGKLIESGFDFIFFTGSSRVGRIVMKQAAETLTPVVLELGGRNPAIVCDDASLDQAVRQIAWGKFNNAGQACVAPDHVYVPGKMKDAFIRAMDRTISEFFGANPETSPDFGRIITREHAERLQSLIESSAPVIGGVCRPEERYIAPTVLDSPADHLPILQEEIFGPVLPVIPYDSLEDLVEEINNRPSSLARYTFTRSRQRARLVMDGTGFGGGVVNGTTIQFASSKLPFGGAGESGMGAGHGRAGFDAFSRTKPVIHRPWGLDLPLAYPGRHMPLKLIRWLMGN